ncbi:hypothetical protein GWK08_08870 [Leptobacterium flavescens]|uniref:Uncharacterized protein n=1 Tax=Leptobacterium flavescens TaxID=472055 RepID=A0A6P0UT36_9FLAO|nr:hypothetical protein [Leptobacterium flavescens]NER13546.1 hypothetical protein [Leptobacterium flavescens]
MTKKEALRKIDQKFDEILEETDKLSIKKTGTYFDEHSSNMNKAHKATERIMEVLETYGKNLSSEELKSKGGELANKAFHRYVK